MSAAALKQTLRKPSDADIDAALNSHLCRCATYAHPRRGAPRCGDCRAGPQGKKA